MDYKLSEHPRYRWGQIVKNIVALNYLYARFLQQSDVEFGQRMRMLLAVFIGSLRAILSIMRRFIGSYLAGICKK